MSNPFAAHVVEVLNRALEADRVAVSELLGHRVPCNEALADDRQVIVRPHHDGTHSLSALGLINGLVGMVPGSIGEIFARVADDGVTILQFHLSEDEPVASDAPPVTPLPA